MFERFIDGYCKLIGYVIAAMLAVMVVLVFGNVFMRYAFNSGFTVSEELSRWLFVWLTFLGAVVALRSNAHLGTDVLVGRLSPVGKRVCLGISLLLMLYCLALIFKGSYQQTIINWDSTSAVMEVSMGYFYASGMVMSVLGGLIVLSDLWRLVTGKIGDDTLIFTPESEDVPHAATDSISRKA
jgi:TRAP-type transport system small permease protein